jgi:hypothetical protein
MSKECRLRNFISYPQYWASNSMLCLYYFCAKFLIQIKQPEITDLWLFLRFIGGSLVTHYTAGSPAVFDAKELVAPQASSPDLIHFSQRIHRQDFNWQRLRSRVATLWTQAVRFLAHIRAPSNAQRTEIKTSWITPLSGCGPAPQYKL